jgi:tetratricopeptide (TPR) repeat protein
MRSLKFAIIFLSLLLGRSFAALAQGAEVRVWEGKIDLPTYLLGEEDPNPPFALVNRHNVYPYTMLDDLTDRRETKSYKALFLENEYLKAIVLPEMGGRLYSLYDKVGKREVFYRNNVVKYGLIALRGAWISGGIEFNFPNGHTVVTVSPVAATLWHEADGSGTVIVGDVDQVSGMHWEVALTLRPGQARLEERVTLFNSTPVTNLYWFWSTAAVPATEDMQFIYPMREANPHSRGEIWTYPVWNGVDFSWYKNVRQPTSLFGRQVHRPFFGSYYHQADAGVVHVADFREVPGKKIWTWGVAGDGLIWTDLLTDKDGAYNEIQSGRYETQLNQEFMAPRRVESWTEYWYPVQGLGGGFVAATWQLAINTRYLPASGAEKPRVEILVSPTEEVRGAKVRVKQGPQLLREFDAAVFKPLASEKFAVPVEDLESAKSKLDVEIQGADGKTLLHWFAGDPVDGNRDFVPAAGVYEPASKSEEKMTVEELFLEGVSEEKNGRQDTEIYRKVLERDPGYVPALLKLAWQQYLSADFENAEGFIARAMARAPVNPQVHYAAGVVYRAAQRWTLAQDALWASIQYGGSAAPAFAQLGEIAIHEKNYAEAAKLLRNALASNPEDALVFADLAVALRLAGDRREASKVARQAAEKMPLLPFALAEEWRLAGGQGASPPSSDLFKKLGTAASDTGAQNYLEVAVWYRGLNDLASSDAVLQAALKELPAKQVSPLVYYYLASNARLQGKEKQAEDYAAQAAAAPYEKVFPNRPADALVLLEALLQHPTDAHGQYFLGNFLCARGRYEDASRVWIQALTEGFEYSVLARNLGLYAWRVKKDLSGAAGFFERAIQLDPRDYRLYTDLDEIYTQLGDTARRERLFAGAPREVLDRDTVRVRRALLRVEQRQYDQALELLMGHRFKPWEGGVGVREMFVLANLEKGREALRAKNFRDAEQSFRKALEYPVNLGVGKPDKPSDEAALCWLGEALEGQGKTDPARTAWQQAAGDGKGKGVWQFYQALALERLGRSSEAVKTFAELAEAPAQGKTSASDYYLAGLAERHRVREEQAQSDFRRALELDPFLWQARIELARAGGSR